jgi:predicted metal-dependent phosphoesterase TrpH
VELAVEKGMDVISITDHDTVKGIEKVLAAAAQYPALSVIPGIEISTDVPSGEVHMLGYFIDFTDDALLAGLSDMLNSRELRARTMVDKLKNLGMPLKWERVLELAMGGAVGRPHITRRCLRPAILPPLTRHLTNILAKMALPMHHVLRYHR